TTHRRTSFDVGRGEPDRLSIVDRVTNETILYSFWCISGIGLGSADRGGGESGTDNTSQINVNIDNLLAEAKRRGAFLYAPQTTSNWSSATLTANVMTMVGQAETTLNVDPRRL